MYSLSPARLTRQSRSGGHPHLIACQSRLESGLLCHVIFHYAFDSSGGSMGECDLIGWQKLYNLSLTLGLYQAPSVVLMRFANAGQALWYRETNLKWHTAELKESQSYCTTCWGYKGGFYQIINTTSAGSSDFVCLLYCMLPSTLQVMQVPKQTWTAVRLSGSSRYHKDFFFFNHLIVLCLALSWQDMKIIGDIFKMLWPIPTDGGCVHHQNTQIRP